MNNLLKFGVLGLLLPVGYAAGSTLPLATLRPLNLQIAPPQPMEGASCNGGQIPFLQLEFSPKAISVGGRMEGITAGLSATNNRGKKGKLLATVQLVNDLGEEIAKGGMKAPAEVSAGRKADVFEFSTDAFEEGGYYQLRAHAAQLADDGAEDTAMEIIYLKVDAGKLVPLTVNEYYANSLANLGVQK